MLAPPISKAIWCLHVVLEGGCWDDLVVLQPESGKMWRHNSFLSEVQLEGPKLPATPSPREIKSWKKPCPECKKTRQKKNHEKCQKSCQKHWVADFFSSTAKTLQLNITWFFVAFTKPKKNRWSWWRPFNFFWKFFTWPWISKVLLLYFLGINKKVLKFCELFLLASCFGSKVSRSSFGEFSRI